MTREQDIERIATVLALAGPFGRWLPSGEQRYLTDADMAAALYDAGPLATEGDAAPGGTVEVFDTADEFIAHLDRLAARLKES